MWTNQKCNIVFKLFDQKAILAPLKEEKIKGGTIAYWNFPVVSVAYWMSCLYGETSVVASQMLPIDIRTCEVEYDSRFSSPVAKKWQCDSIRKK